MITEYEYQNALKIVKAYESQGIGIKVKDFMEMIPFKHSKIKGESTVRLLNALKEIKDYAVGDIDERDWMRFRYCGKNTWKQFLYFKNKILNDNREN